MRLGYKCFENSLLVSSFEAKSKINKKHAKTVLIRNQRLWFRKKWTKQRDFYVVRNGTYLDVYFSARKSKVIDISSNFIQLFTLLKIIKMVYFMGNLKVLLF